MRNQIILSLWTIATLQLCAAANIYTLDMSNGFGMDSFAESEIPLKISASVTEKSNHRDLPNNSKYILKFPSSNTLVFDAHIGSVSVAYKNEDEAGRLVFYGNDPKHYLTVEEALIVFEQFHDTFGIEKDSLYKWFETVQQGLGARGYYQAGARTHYPSITLEAANSFFDDKPLFLNLIVSFDDLSFKRLGISAETNMVTGLTFDIPAIIESARAQNAKDEPTQDTEETPVRVAEITTEAQVVDTESGKPNEINPIEVVKETPEGKSSKWWLWLIGLLILVGGLTVVIRRKS